MARVVVAMVLGLAGGLASASAGAAAAPPTSAVAVFARLGEWPSGYVGNITITNRTATTITGWRVEFDLPAGTHISSSHSSVLTRVDNHYVFRNAPWNGTLPPDTSVSFGWVAAGLGTPMNCTLNGFDCAGVPADHTAPGRPGPLAFDSTAGLTLTWAASADDHGPVTYEVYETGRLLTTVTDNRYVYSNGPTLPPKIYVFGVRAVDGAGNPSMFSFRSLGQIWRGDEIPGAPTQLRADTPAPGLLRLSWPAVPGSAQLSVPPIAGYEVFLDGVPVGQVGNSVIILPAPPPGPHRLGVRTVNAVDQRSALVELTHEAG